MEDLDEFGAPSEEQGNFTNKQSGDDLDDDGLQSNDTYLNESVPDEQFPGYDYSQIEEKGKTPNSENVAYPQTPVEPPNTSESGGGTSTALLVILILLVVITLAMLGYCYVRQVRRRGGGYRRNRSGPRWVGVHTQESEMTSMRRRGAGVI